MLSAMFSGRHNLSQDSSGCYFIDRDGKLFKYILNFLRNLELNLPSNQPHLVAELLLEAEYFQLQTLVSFLKALQSKNEMPIVTFKEFLLYANSSRPIQAPFLNMSGIILKYLDLTGANLQGCDFSNTSIFEVNFSSANLSCCVFDCSKVHNSIFIDAVLRKASCVSANFSGNDMKRAVCVEADFTKAKLGGADMRNCDLQSANLQDANLLVANMEGCNLLLANVKGANFEGANTKSAKGVPLH
jgi:uncharacterized protein YjbI with pentapeptide repeats